MTILDQQFFNVIVAVCGFLGGWTLKVLYDDLKDLKAADMKLTEKVASIEVLVAGEYVKKDEFATNIAALFAKLDRIEDKLDKKVDR